MVDKSSSVPLYQQILTILERQILSGELKAGTRIMSENELASTYQVSRVTARQAIEQLVSKNLLYRQAGKGTFVSEDSMAFDFSSMLSFSRNLENRGFHVETRVLHQGISPGSPEIGRKLAIRAEDELLVIRRLRYIDGIAAAIHTSYFQASVYAPLLRTDLAHTSLLEAAEKIIGVRMSYSTDSLRSIPVSAPDAELLGMSEGQPALELEGVVFDDNNSPTRFTKGIYRGDMFRFDIKNTRLHSGMLRVTEAAST